MEKFQRSYRIVIDPKDGGEPIIVGMPITCQFWIKRNQMSSLNYMSLDIYNLSKDSRDRIFQDRFTTLDRTVTFEGGYDVLSMVFSGVIFEAGSYREGTNIITRIEARSGEFDVITTQTYQAIEKGKTVGDVLDFLAAQFPTLEKGVIGDFPDKLLRPVTLSGNTYDLFKEYSNGSVFIDNNRIYALADNEVIEGELAVISDKTGILETPRRDEGFLSVTTLFEPRLQVGQSVQLESSIMPVYNGQYKCIGIMHQGIISESVSGECRSVFDLFIGNNTFSLRE